MSILSGVKRRNSAWRLNSAYQPELMMMHIVNRKGKGIMLSGGADWTKVNGLKLESYVNTPEV